MEGLYKSFFSCLEKYQPKSQKPQQTQVQMSIIRSLFAIGNICKYYNFDGGTMIYCLFLYLHQMYRRKRLLSKASKRRVMVPT